jgi:hypothetical protein
MASSWESVRAMGGPAGFLGIAPLSYSSRLSLLSRLSEPASLALVLPSSFDVSAGIVTPLSFVLTGAFGAS